MFIQMLSCELGTCCGDPGIAVILDIVRRVISLIQLVVPIALLVFASIDFTKLVINPDRKGGLKPIFNMFLAAAVVFLIPVIVNATLNMLPDSFELSACWDEARNMAESTRTQNFEYITPYDDEKRSPIYIDPSEYEKGDPSVSGGDAKGLLEGAVKVHKMYEQNGWSYYTANGQLRWGNIKYSTNNPSRKTCCATFIGSALYVGGVYSEAELNKYNYNSVYGISKFCQEHGWIKISNYNDLKAGDVVIMNMHGGTSLGHVQLYMGNGTWYNAGATSAIQRSGPYKANCSKYFLYAWRMPA